MSRSQYTHLLDTEYPAIRRVMQEDLQWLDDEGLEEHLVGLFPGTEPDDVENFMRTLQQFGRKAAPIAQKALPGIVQGAVKGGMVAGPWGALAGGVAGGVGSVLAGGKSAPPRAAPMQTVQGPTKAPGAMPVQGTTGAAALRQLLFLLSRPEAPDAASPASEGKPRDNNNAASPITVLAPAAA